MSLAGFPVRGGYPDGWPEATLPMNTHAAAIIPRHGRGPAEYDLYGAREAIIIDHDVTYFLHYDGIGINSRSEEYTDALWV